MKQVAWLNTVPRSKEKKLNKRTDSQRPMTRLETLKSKGAQPDWPPLENGSYLIGHLFECGPMISTGMGSSSIGWADLQAWQAAVGVDLESWEIRALRRLSSDYLSASQEAEDPDCPAPYIDQVVVENRAAVANAVRNIFGSRKVQRRADS